MWAEGRMFHRYPTSRPRLNSTHQSLLQGTVERDDHESLSASIEPCLAEARQCELAKAMRLSDMLPTPSTSHVNYSHIYEPSEDSYLLLDTLSSQSEIELLRNAFPAKTVPPLILEVGVGSGVVLAFVNANAERIFGRSDIATLGIDVNVFACTAAQQTVKLAASEVASAQTKTGIFLDTFVDDLTSAVKSRSIDVLIFNPPYVPSETLPEISCEKNALADAVDRDSHLLSFSTDGGVDGMETTTRLLDQLEGVLSDRGVAYVLLCAQNRPDEVMARIRNWSNVTNDNNNSRWYAEKVRSSGKQAGWERLCVIRIWRENATS